MTREEESLLVLKVQNGDSASFEKLVLENQTKVYNLALRMLGNEEDAFDMSQEAFIKAYNSIGNFRGESRFSVWLYRLTTNVCLDFLRSEGRKSHGSLTYMSDDDDEKEIDIPDERFSPETIIQKKELRQAVNRGLMSLPKDYRIILLLREIEGLTYDEIAKALSIEEGTVKSRIFRARKKLCAILSADGNFSYNSSSNEAKEV
ncbi:MAG: sigma-70 family RNA polymerase sigma factor [Clostridiales bacterium]|jgi:RNA polymerase sigma factor (sigma-70 family)|nr:sigma-70 family RNA polymerase sigma factor [Clostridiales bacterium]